LLRERQALGPDAYVFGNQNGQRAAFSRAAWNRLVLLANGFKARRTRRGGALDSNAREALRKIDLHFHDLRHEYASRLLENDAPLFLIRQWLGHAEITTTMRYLNIGETFDAELQAKWFGSTAVPVVSPEGEGKEGL
jgi:integrase